MTTSVEINDVVKNINLLQKYDYIDIEDKKRMNTKDFLYRQNMQKSAKIFWTQCNNLKNKQR